MHWSRLLLLTLGIGVLVYLFHRLGPEQVLGLSRRVGWNVLVVAAIYALYQFVRAAALSRCMMEGRGDSIWSLLAIRLAGEAVQYLTFTGPFLAEPAKAWLLKARGHGTEAAFAATITEYLSYTFTSAAMSAAALAYLLSCASPGPRTAVAARIILYLMVLFLAVSAVAVWRRIYLIGAVLRSLSRLPGLRKALRLDMPSVRRMEDLLLLVFRERPRRFLAILSLELAAQSLLVLELYWILRAMDLDFPAATPFAVEGAGKFISLAFFFIPVQVGAAEGAYVVILQAVGLEAAAGLALSLLRRMRSLLVAACGLTAFWFTRRAADP